MEGYSGEACEKDMDKILEALRAEGVEIAGVNKTVKPARWETQERVGERGI